MKRCVECRTILADGDVFCPKCGMRQIKSGRINASNAVVLERKTARDIYNDAISLARDTLENSEVVSKAVESASSNGLHKVALAGIALIALSAFMPIINVGFMELSLMDYSKVLGALFLILCGLMGWAVTQKKYSLLVVSANSFFIFFAVEYVNYIRAMAELRRSFLGALAGNVLSLEFGVYVFLLGLLTVEVIGLFCGAMENSGTIGLGELVKQWKKCTFGFVKVLGIPLPGFVWSIILAVALLFVASHANPLNSLQQELRGYKKMFR